MACDFVGDGDGCDANDLDALYAGTDGAPTPLTDELVEQWLVDASDVANPLKPAGVESFVHGDVNFDGRVDSVDFDTLISHFGESSVTGWRGADFNGDRVVDSTDLGLLLNNYGSDNRVEATVVEVTRHLCRLAGRSGRRIGRSNGRTDELAVTA